MDDQDDGQDESDETEDHVLVTAVPQPSAASKHDCATP